MKLGILCTYLHVFFFLIQPVIQETTDGQCTKVSEDPVSVSDSVDAADEHAAAMLLTVSFFSSWYSNICYKCVCINT